LQVGQDKKSIAVLPFKNMSNDPDQEYFSDGMMEEILDRLFKIGDLKVICRAYFHFKVKWHNL
jgi:TolB-like protein